MTNNEVLIVEDRTDMQMTIGASLQGVCKLTFVSTLAEAREALKSKRFDLCLLDVMLPDGNGFSFCASLRNESSSTQLPLFFLTERSSSSDKIQAFQLGADDYITKPFDPGELKARVSARLRSSQNQGSDAKGTTTGNLKVVVPTQRASIQLDNGSSVTIDLSPIEFRILHYFIRHEDHVISRSQLLEAVWGLNLNVNDRTVDTHVSHLRKKMVGASHEIKAIKGAGYTFRRIKIVATSVSQPAVLDKTRLLILEETGGSDFVADVLQDFMRNFELALVELKNCLKDKDAKRIAYLCHSIRSSSANVGATSLISAYKHLEVLVMRSNINWMAAELLVNEIIVQAPSLRAAVSFDTETRSGNA